VIINNTPAPSKKKAEIRIGADGAKATAKNPARSGGKACPRELKEALTPRVSPLSVGGVRLDKSAEKFTICTPFGIEKNGVMTKISQKEFGTKYISIAKATNG
jgi:hypothetical protein